jgi:hypothetical protein
VPASRVRLTVFDIVSSEPFLVVVVVIGPHSPKAAREEEFSRTS